MNDDWAYFGFCSIPALGNGISSPQAVYEIWSEEFAGYYEFGGCYVLTMHPFVIGRPSRIRLLDRLDRVHEDVRWRLVRHAGADRRACPGDGAGRTGRTRICSSRHVHEGDVIVAAARR